MRKLRPKKVSVAQGHKTAAEPKLDSTIPSPEIGPNQSLSKRFEQS